MKLNPLHRRCESIALATSFVALGYVPVVRPRRLRWGAADEEVRRPFFGDDLAPAHSRLETMHAVTIHVPAAQAGPRLVHIGQDKGGFYSCACLENLCGCHLHNADRIVPEWQQPCRKGRVVKIEHDLVQPEVIGEGIGQ